MTPKVLLQFMFRNIGWKLLSLGLAMLVWIAISREPEIASVLAAPVSTSTLRHIWRLVQKP